MVRVILDAQAFDPESQVCARVRAQRLLEVCLEVLYLEPCGLRVLARELGFPFQVPRL